MLQRVADYVKEFGYAAIGTLDLSFEQIVMHSSEAGPRKAFAAIEGARNDGHDFIEEAYRAGTRVFFISSDRREEVETKYINWLTSACFLYMPGEKTDRALIESARMKARRLGGEIIGITGSSGKTTVKKMISQLLSPKFEVFKAKKSFNTPLGISVEILNAKPNADFYIFEYGARKKGDIEELVGIANPTISVITNIGYAHIGIFGSRDMIFEEKIKLAKAESVREVYLNSDDDYFEKAVKELKSYCCRIYSAGRSQSSDLVYEIKSVDELGYPLVGFRFRKRYFEFKLSIPGLHNVANFAIASLVALKNGLESDDFLKAAAEVRLPKMRLEILKRGNFIFINDAYNSNPASLKSALEFLFTFKRSSEVQKIAVLGDMLELGELSSIMHEEAGKTAKTLGIDNVIYYGEYFDDFKRGFGNENLYRAQDVEDAASILKKIGSKGAVVLLKASRALGLERVLEHV